MAKQNPVNSIRDNEIHNKCASFSKSVENIHNISENTSRKQIKANRTNLTIMVSRSLRSLFVFSKILNVFAYL